MSHLRLRLGLRRARQPLCIHHIALDGVVVKRRLVHDHRRSPARHAQQQEERRCGQDRHPGQSGRPGVCHGGAGKEGATEEGEGGRGEEADCCLVCRFAFLSEGVSGAVTTVYISRHSMLASLASQPLLIFLSCYRAVTLFIGHSEYQSGTTDRQCHAPGPAPD